MRARARARASGSIDRTSRVSDRRVTHRQFVNRRFVRSACCLLFFSFNASMRSVCAYYVVLCVFVKGCTRVLNVHYVSFPGPGSLERWNDGWATAVREEGWRATTRRRRGRFSRARDDDFGRRRVVTAVVGMTR